MKDVAKIKNDKELSVFLNNVLRHVGEHWSGNPSSWFFLGRSPRMALTTDIPALATEEDTLEFLQKLLDADNQEPEKAHAPAFASSVRTALFRGAFLFRDERIINWSWCVLSKH
jgi:hypothetical protein